MKLNVLRWKWECIKSVSLFLLGVYLARDMKGIVIAPTLPGVSYR